MKRLILYILLVASIVSYAQEHKGDASFKIHDYNTAIKYYQKALKKSETGILHQKLGKAYLFAKDYTNADKHYSRSLTFEDKNDSTLFQYAKALLILNHKDEARKYFQVYADKYPKNQLAKQYISLYDSLINEENRKPEFSVQTIEGAINTSKSEYGAKPYKNGLLYITEKSHDLVNDQNNKLVNSNYFGIFYSNSNQEGELFNYKLNSTWNNGSVVLHPDGKSIYFTKTYRNRKTDVMQLFYCKIEEGDKLSKPISFEYNNKEYSILHPSFSEDGKILYFSSNKKGGKGGWDIYYSKKDRKYGWLAPKPINGIINTAGNEVFPHASKGNLYFSSDGHFGFGGLDLFKARKNEYYKNCYNLGAPINSPKDDFSIYYTSKLGGYFSSDRPSGKGKDDIYQFTEIEHPIEIDTSASISGVFQFKKLGLAQQELILYDENGNEIERIITGKDGKFVFKNLKSGTNYTILPAEEIEDAELFLTNSKGEKIILADNDGKKFIFKTLKSDYTETLLPIEEEDPSFLIIPVKGYVYKNIKGDVNDRLEVKVYDESGNLIGRTYTQKDGTFIFKTLTPQNNYFFEIDDEEEELQLIILNKGKEKETAEKQNDGKFLFKRIKNNDDAILIVNENNDLIRILQNERFSVNNILYATNSAELNIDAITELNKLYIMYKKNIHLTFTIESHTDSKGSDKYNLKLSEKRAKKVVEYLEKKGIPSDHLIPKGYGESKLLNKCGDNSNCSDEEHAINRRTEVKIKGKKTEF